MGKRNKGKSLVVVEIAGRKRRGNKAGEFSIRNYMTNQIMFKGTAQQCADYASTTLGVVYLYSSQRKVLDDRYIFERTDENEYASKKKVRTLTLSNFKSFHMVTEIKTVWYW